MISKQHRAFPEGVRHQSQGSCITPTTTTAALWLCGSSLRRAGALKRGKTCWRGWCFTSFSLREKSLRFGAHRVGRVSTSGVMVCCGRSVRAPEPRAPPAHHPHFSAQHLARLASSPPWAPSPAGISALQSNVAWLSACCESPEKAEENWEELLALTLTAFPAFCTHHHFQEALGDAWHIHPSGKAAPAPAGGGADKRCVSSRPPRAAGPRAGAFLSTHRD